LEIIHKNWTGIHKNWKTLIKLEGIHKNGKSFLETGRHSQKLEGNHAVIKDERWKKCLEILFQFNTADLPAVLGTTTQAEVKRNKSDIYWPHVPKSPVRTAVGKAQTDTKNEIR